QHADLPAVRPRHRPALPSGGRVVVRRRGRDRLGDRGAARHPRPRRRLRLRTGHALPPHPSDRQWAVDPPRHHPARRVPSARPAGGPGPERPLIRGSVTMRGGTATTRAAAALLIGWVLWG